MNYSGGTGLKGGTAPKPPANRNPKPPANNNPKGNKAPKQGNNKPKGGNKTPKLLMPGSVHKGHVVSYLNPMTAKQIQKQATKTIRAAYAPEFQDLNQQTNQANSLAEKRTADNQYYLNWLNQQQTALKASSDASNQSIQNMENSLYGDQTRDFASQSPNLVDAANARAGNVSNNAQAAPLTTGLGDEQANENAALAATTASGLGQQQLGQNMLAATGANNAASIGDLERENVGSLQKTLTSIAAARSKLGTAEPGDIQKEIARLQGVEVQKAQYRSNLALTGQKLNLDAANINSEINTRNAQVKISAANAQTSRMNALTSISRAQQTAMNENRQFKLDSAKFDQLTAKDLYERQHGLGPYKPGSSTASKTINDHGATVNKPLGQASQNVIFSKVNEYANALRVLRDQHGMSTDQAWHFIASGGHVKGLSTGSVDTNLLTVAQSVVFGGGLDRGDINILHSLGVVIGSRLPVVSFVPHGANGPTGA